MTTETKIDDGHAEKLNEWKTYILPILIGLLMVAAIVLFIYFSRYTLGGSING